VAEHLGLGPEYQAWLDYLQAVGPPAVEVPLLGREQVAAALRHIGLDEPDLGGIVRALPAPDCQPDLWWLLERCYEAVRRDIGQPGAMRTWPTLPPHLDVAGRCFWIWVYLAAAPYLRRWHRERGIPDDVSSNTIADLARHIRLYRLRTGRVGCDEQFWFSWHFRGELFELGRLQFNPHRLMAGLAGPLFWYDTPAIEALGDGFRADDPALGVHIPESGPLTPSACDASFQAAREFFARFFPDQNFRVATCTSWLMDDQLLDYLDPDSNIVRFQRRFDLLPGTQDADSEPVRFVFHRELSELDRVVPRTRLEHAIVNHLAAGRHWRMRTGALRL
jgi:hypothetical protein